MTLHVDGQAAVRHGHMGQLKIRHLVVLAAIAKEGSFKAAANSIGYAQSTLSRLVTELEECAGTRVVERPMGARSVRLTRAGEVLVRHADAILAQLRAAGADVARTHAPRTLRVGIDPSTLPAVLPVLKRSHGDDGLHLALTLATEARVFEQLEHGELEFGITELPLPVGPFECAELLRDRLHLVLPTHTQLSPRKGPRSLDEVAHLPLILRTGSRLHDRVEAELRATGRPVRVVHRVGSDATALALVSGADGAAILPRLSLPPRDGVGLVIDLQNMLAPRAVALLWHRARCCDILAERFRQLAIATCSQLAVDQDAV